MHQDCSNMYPSMIIGGNNKTEKLTAEALNISWHLTYSGVSLFERTSIDSFNSLMTPENHAVAESDYHQVKAQDKVDLQSKYLHRSF